MGVPRPFTGVPLPATTEPKAPWAGDGVMLTKSAKLNPVWGVCGAPPPGVFITEDGRAKDGGGVVGGRIFVLDIAPAGEGDVAKYIKRSTPSSPPCLVPSFATRRGGVRGGLE